MEQDYFLNQRETIERIKEIDQQVIAESTKIGRKDKSKITRLRFEQMLRGLYLTQNPMDVGRFY